MDEFKNGSMNRLSKNDAMNKCIKIMLSRIKNGGEKFRVDHNTSDSG